ncbi:30S ribosome-binding factor RbfA [Albibacterium indicum]|uniref:30S ribosome-binding factor RbfA n=1 Tax=Albibacterium indicum TaxID=2292082 RepID=UPI00197EAC0F|nr:30S ribosome-binding factor RbfA [Pedobacter indicus]
MESKRQQKFARIIQQDLGDIFLREGNSWLPGVMITVTSVRVTSDLGIARVYLSFLNAKSPQEAIDQVKSKSGEIRYKLGNKIKDQAKSVPTLEFFIDDSVEYRQHIDKLFDEINKGKAGNKGADNGDA